MVNASGSGDISFDVDGNPNRPTLFVILLVVTFLLVISLFFFKNPILFILMILSAILAFILKPKKSG